MTTPAVVKFDGGTRRSYGYRYIVETDDWTNCELILSLRTVVYIFVLDSV